MPVMRLRPEGGRHGREGGGKGRGGVGRGEGKGRKEEGRAGSEGGFTPTFLYPPLPLHTIINRENFYFKVSNRLSTRIHQLIQLDFIGRPLGRLWYPMSSVCLSVCLSPVTICIVAKRHILAKNCLKEQIG